MMKKLPQVLFLLSLIGLCGFSWPFPWLMSTNKAPFGTEPWLTREMQIIQSQARNIDNKVLRLSLIAYLNARKKGYAGKPILTVIDYSKPSNERRLWVFD